jgi:arabinofuranosyltransferase
VQAFTHPLWVFLITPIYAMTGEVYFAVIRISLVLSMLTMVLFAYKIARSLGAAILGILALSFSAAFVDFSTSGLENPLTFLVLAIFLYIYFTNKQDLRILTLLCLIASIGAVNRLDTILLFLPMLVYVFWINRSGRAVVVALIGFIPLIAWEVFSLIYYGYPFPNTAYAKLNTGIARPDLWQHGLWYILYSLRTDPITVIMILSGIIMPLITRGHRMAAPAIGIILYIIYVINIGGCFMAGRYLAAPLFMAVILLSQYRKIPTSVGVIWLLIILSLGLTPNDSPVYARLSDKGEPSKIWHGVVRERGRARARLV